MAVYGADDIAGMMQEFGSVVTHGVDSTYGIVDRPDEEIFERDGVGVSAENLTVTIETGSLPALAVGETLNVEGMDYNVQRMMKVKDGALERIWCSLS